MTYQLAGWISTNSSGSNGIPLDTAETVEGNVYRLLAAPGGSTDYMALQINDTTFANSAVQYGIAGGVAVAQSMAGIHSMPELDFTGEIYLGSAAIEDMGGHSLEEYEFLEIAQSGACVGAILSYAGAFGLFVYEVAGARNPAKLPGIFGRVAIRVNFVIAAALAIDNLCNEEET